MASSNTTANGKNRKDNNSTVQVPIKTNLSSRDHEIMARFDAGFNIMSNESKPRMQYAVEKRDWMHIHDEGGLDILPMLVRQEIEKNPAYVIQLALELRERILEVRKDYLVERGDWEELEEKMQEHEEERRKWHEEDDEE